MNIQDSCRFGHIYGQEKVKVKCFQQNKRKSYSTITSSVQGKGGGDITII